MASFLSCPSLEIWRSSLPGGMIGGLIYSCSTSSSEFRARAALMSFAQDLGQPEHLPAVGDAGISLLPRLPNGGYPTRVRMEKSPEICFQIHKPFFRFWRKSLHAKKLFIFKIRVTGLLIRMKWGSINGTVNTYPSGDWSWGMALKQRRGFILDLMVLRLSIYLSTFKTFLKKEITLIPFPV